MNHQIASSTTMTIRMIAHIGKPLEVGAATGAVTLAAVAWALRAADSALRAAPHRRRCALRGARSCRAKAAETGEKPRGAEHLRKFRRKRGRDCAFLTVQHRKD